MVEYALAGLDNKIFVSTYMLALPDTKTLEDFLLKETRKKLKRRAESRHSELASESLVENCHTDLFTLNGVY